MSERGSAAAEADRRGSCDTLFYDGRCPLCADEIETLRAVRGDDLELVDIHGEDVQGSEAARAAEPEAPTTRCGETPTSTCGPLGESAPTRDDLLRTLHLRRADGQWLRGADANVAAWEGTRRGRLLRVLRWPLLRHLVDLGYALWARWRYRRLYGSQYCEEVHAPRS